MSAPVSFIGSKNCANRCRRSAYVPYCFALPRDSFSRSWQAVTVIFCFILPANHPKSRLFSLRDNVTVFFNTLYIYTYMRTQQIFPPCKEYYFSVTLSQALANTVFSMFLSVTNHKIFCRLLSPRRQICHAFNVLYFCCERLRGVRVVICEREKSAVALIELRAPCV